MKALQAWRGHAGEGEELVFAKRVVIDNPIEGLPLAIGHCPCRNMYQEGKTQLQAVLLVVQGGAESTAGSCPGH